MSATLAQRAKDIERLLEAHYAPEAVRIGQSIAETQKRIEQSAERLAGMIAAVTEEERQRVIHLEGEERKFEAELDRLAKERVPLDVELAELNAYLNHNNEKEDTT